jgi:gliding motility-associated-like protein
MSKHFLIFLVAMSLVCTAYADHISGGEMFYSYEGFLNGQHRYSVTLKFYMRCNSGRQFNNPSRVAVYEKGTGREIMVIEAALTSTQTINRQEQDDCITNPPAVCYEVGYYNFSVSLPESSTGYILAAQVNFRINGINNLIQGYNNIGATYTGDIPGNGVVTDAPKNNSAHFIGSDLVVVCENNSFSYSFAATDADKDELRYSFCEAYRSSGGGIGAGGANGSVAPPAPPYQSVPYRSPAFSASVPLGNKVRIDAKTGLITGIAPESGIYVVTVCVEEIRNGKVIATQRKDLQINITSCSIIAANLPPEYQLCTDTKTITFANDFSNPRIKTYFWELSDQNGNPFFSSTQSQFTHTFQDTGIYSIKLAINRGEACKDSAVSIVRVYPGLKSDFITEGICFTKPTLFGDRSTTVYGSINSWTWDFGEPTEIVDRSVDKNPQYTYPFGGPKEVSLITGTTKGCQDTITKTVSIVEKPPLNFAFTDTLICLKDSVQLIAGTIGQIVWTPSTGMQTPPTSSPKVSPPVTTVYYADLNDNGCTNRDSLRVRVTDKVNLSVMNDTSVCAGDTIQLRIQSDALQFTWSPAGQVNNASLAQPFAITPATTRYGIRANIGSCVAQSSINVITIPYPLVNAGADTMICFNTGAFLAGSSNGTSTLWAPATSVAQPSQLNTSISPASTTTYTLFAYDNKGCPKPASDQVTVVVLPALFANAGRDTAVMVGQSLQLQASGGTNYLWSPATGLSDYAVADPIAIYSVPAESINYSVAISNQAGCTETAFIKVRVFKEGDEIYVPNAFTPNSDGLNDIIRPVNVSIRQMEYFKVFNRWGKLLYSTSSPGAGWDGKINGVLQGSDTFVWVFKGTDYKGKSVMRKGTVTLIR